MQCYTQHLVALPLFRVKKTLRKIHPDRLQKHIKS
jgi:hypothetical protein